MPWLITAKTCTVCGDRHDFSCAEADIPSGGRYTFTCPKDVAVGTILFPTEWGQVVAACPRGSVQVRELPPGS